MKRLTGASLVASRGDAPLLEAGGGEKYPFPLVVPDRLLEDGDTVELGGTVLRARVTAGHTPGCTSWTTELEEGGEPKSVVFVCGVNAFPSMDLLAVTPKYPEGRARAFERSFEVLEGLPCDIFLGSHGSFFLLGKKMGERGSAVDNPFVDPELYRRHVARKKSGFEEEFGRQREAAEIRLLDGPQTAVEPRSVD